MKIKLSELKKLIKEELALASYELESDLERGNFREMYFSLGEDEYELEGYVVEVNSGSGFLEEDKWDVELTYVKSIHDDEEINPGVFEDEVKSQNMWESLVEEAYQLAM
jgi:hypothetical protein